MSTGRRAIFMEAIAIVGREEESIGSKGVAIHLAKIIGDLAGAGISVLELQNGLLHLAGGQAHLDGALGSAATGLPLSGTAGASVAAAGSTIQDGLDGTAAAERTKPRAAMVVVVVKCMAFGSGVVFEDRGL